MSKAVRFISIFFARRLLEFSFWCKESRRKLKQNSSISNNESGSELQPNLKLDLSPFVLYLEGEEDLVELITESNCNATDCWIHMRKKTQQKLSRETAGETYAFTRIQRSRNI